MHGWKACSAISVVVGTTTCLRALQLEKALCSISVRLAGKVMDARELL